MAELSLKSCTAIFEKMMRRDEESSFWKSRETVFNLKKWKAVTIILKILFFIVKEIRDI